MPNACRNCFHREGPVAAIDVKPGRGACDYCPKEQKGKLVWDVSIFRELFLTLLESYEPCTEGRLVEPALREDWDIFSLDAVAAGKLLHDMLPNHPYVAKDFRIARANRQGESFVDVWRKYIAHLVSTNRFFPPPMLTLESLSPLSEVIDQGKRPINLGTSLYRGRISSDGLQLPKEQMGMPPPDLARSGRCNSIGIPHLYVAFDATTCAAECRAGANDHVSIARFLPARELSVLDLDELDAINPFATTTSDAVQSYLEAREVLMRLRREMAVPMRSSDIQAEYIPTQFLCEYVKHQGLDGIVYPSTLHQLGVNAVLFDESVVSCQDDIELFKVSHAALDIEKVPIQSL